MTITDNVNEVQSGDTFYAIKGVNVDGADFVHQAVQKGATKIVADHMIDCGVPVQVVDDVRHTFAVDCTKQWPSDKIKKVAVYAVESLFTMRASVLGYSCQKAKTKAPWGVGVGSFKPFTTHSQRLVVKRNVE